MMANTGQSSGAMAEFHRCSAAGCPLKLRVGSDGGQKRIDFCQESHGDTIRNATKELANVTRLLLNLPSTEAIGAASSPLRETVEIENRVFTLSRTRISPIKNQLKKIQFRNQKAAIDKLERGKAESTGLLLLLAYSAARGNAITAWQDRAGSVPNRKPYRRDSQPLIRHGGE